MYLYKEASFMENYENSDTFPYTLDESEWGNIVRFAEECPGMFYLATIFDGPKSHREMYAVTENDYQKKRPTFRALFIN